MGNCVEVLAPQSTADSTLFVPGAKLNIGELCNGSTTDSDSVCWGSNPYSPAIKRLRKRYSPEKSLIFKDFFAFIGRDFKIQIHRYNQGIFQHSKDLNSNALTIE